jgi:hypothetical protein
MVGNVRLFVAVGLTRFAAKNEFIRSILGGNIEREDGRICSCFIMFFGILTI